MRVPSGAPVRTRLARCARRLLVTLTCMVASPVPFGVAALLQAQSVGVVTGTVASSQAGEPVANASVRIIGTRIATRTRPDGRYTLRAPAGKHDLQASAPGYATERRPLVVEAGQVASSDFELERSAVPIDEVVAIGSRRADRTVFGSLGPIDVLTANEIVATGLAETGQILQRLVPSFNSPRPALAGGSDHVRPAMLRGLAPDQVLVLVNGKRRHAGALLHVNGAVGRGSSAPELNAIPAGAIERIEILRDGASAQYGSDAVAGVINIVLRERGEGRLTSVAGQTAEGDGTVVRGVASYGVALGERGWLGLSAELRDRGATDRSYPDRRPQYFAGDPRNEDPDGAGRVNHRHGDPATQDVAVFLNGALPFENGLEIYGFGGYGARRGESADSFRRALDDRTVRAIHPEGFLPLIASDIRDASAAIGVRGLAGGWSWELAGAFGASSVAFGVKNSVNASLGAASPTAFHAGAQRLGQATLSLDLLRALDGVLPVPVSVAAGLELRRESYGIEAGEEASYADGGVPVLDGPNRGAAAPAGAQGFPGFRPSDEVDALRRSVSAYLGVEGDLSDRLLVGLDARADRVGGLGPVASGKLAVRYEPVKNLALRGAAGTGFRAPSLAQRYFSSSAVALLPADGAVAPLEIRTFPVESPEAGLLGAEPLRPERSASITAGLALTPARGLSIAVDLYRIAVAGRIVLTGDFVDPGIRERLESGGFEGVGGGRFFTNAVDTETDGVDVVARYGFAVGAGGSLRLTGALSLMETEVTRVAAAPPALSGREDALLDRVERGRIEEGQPRSGVALGVDYTIRALRLSLHNRRFGAVTSRGPVRDGSADQAFGARWVTDLDLACELRGRLEVAVGGNNIFDVYPDPIRDFAAGGPLSGHGVFRYSGVSPFGFNGAFYFVRLSYRL